MHPALAECVQNLTLPASVATARARRGAMMSLPSCGPSERGAPQSFVYWTRPTTGKTKRLAFTAAGLVEVTGAWGLTPFRPGSSWPGYCAGPGDAAATPAERPSSSKREIPPRAVVRWRRIRLRFALEGPNPSKGFGALQNNFVRKFASAAMVIVQAMKIAVCVKQVPDAGAPKRIDPQTKRLDRSVEGELNPFDVHAVEEALRIKEAGEGEVVLVTLGPAKATESLRRALAMGADRSVLVSDEAAEGSDLVATSRILAAALEREGADLILFGQQSSDSDGAVLWSAVADRLRLPVVSQVAELEVADGKVKAKRQTEFGYDVIEAPTPAVVAVSDAINE